MRNQISKQFGKDANGWFAIIPQVADSAIKDSNGKDIAETYQVKLTAGTDYVTPSGLTTTLASYATKSDISSVYKVKGSVATADNLPATAVVGDVYNALDTGANWVYTEEGWDKLSETVDLSGYQTKLTAGVDYATPTQLGDGTVTKLGTATVGGATQPVYLSNGAPAVCNEMMDLRATDQVVTRLKYFEGSAECPLRFRAKSLDISTSPTDVNVSNYDFIKVDKNNAFIRRYCTIHRTNGQTDHRTYFYGADGKSFYKESIVKADGDHYETAPTPSASAPTSAVVTKGYVESTDGATNNLLHRTADETTTGTKYGAWATAKLTLSDAWVKITDFNVSDGKSMRFAFDFQNRYTGGKATGQINTTSAEGITGGAVSVIAHANPNMTFGAWKDGNGLIWLVAKKVGSSGSTLLICDGYKTLNTNTTPFAWDGTTTYLTDEESASVVTFTSMTTLNISDIPNKSYVNTLVSAKQSKFTTQTVTIATSDWTEDSERGYVADVTIGAFTDDDLMWVDATPAYKTTALNNGVYVYSSVPSEGRLRFCAYNAVQVEISVVKFPA